MNSSPLDNTPELHDDGSPPAAPDALSPHASIPAPMIASTPTDHLVEALPISAASAPNKDFRLGWIDLFYLAAFYLGTGLLLYWVVSIVAIDAFGVSRDASRQSTEAQSTVLIVAQLLLSGATMAFLYGLVRGRTSAPFWPAMGWRVFGNVASRTSTAARYVLGGFALALIVGILGRYVSGSSPVPLEEMFRTRQSVLLMMALGILVAPLVEETVFRGCLYPVIARRFGLWVGVVVTGTLFGLAHAQQLGGAVGQVSLLILVGIILTYIRARSGTVMASYLVHLGYNTILFAGFYLATGGLKHLPGS
jgi:membrane protease YdiL (CAAX protease family)